MADTFHNTLSNKGWEKLVISAALLHDIGKFWQRTHEKVVKHHAFYTADFIKDSNMLPLPKGIDREKLAIIASHHHNNPKYPVEVNVSGIDENCIERRLARIVCIADQLSAGMDREQDSEPDPKRPLISIFNRINLQDHKAFYGKKVHYPKILNLNENIFPEEKDEKKKNNIHLSYKKIWDKFTLESKKLPVKSFNSWIFSLDALLRKYLFYIPSAGYYSTPDIPLYDHLKTTAAIATVLHRHYIKTGSAPDDTTGELKRYLFVHGDISGIQDFIFNVRNTKKTAKGKARRLRGRSIWISLFTEAVITRILTELNMTELNILQNSAGNFILLLHHTEEIVGFLTKMKQKIEKYLFSCTAGRIRLTLCWEPFSANDLKDYGNSKEILAVNAFRVKQQPWESLLPEMITDLSQDNFPRNTGESCDVCGLKTESSAIDDEIYLCYFCKNTENLGKMIPGSSYLVKKLKGKTLNNDFVEIFGVDFRFTHYIKENWLNSPGNIYILNDSDFLHITEINHSDCGFSFRWFGNTMPLISVGDNNDRLLINFDQLAQMTQGSEKLGYLKADVDNLGAVFIEGFKTNRSISRLHRLSLEMDLFFAGFINRLGEKEKIYTYICDNCKKDIVWSKEIIIEEKEDRLLTKEVYWVKNDSKLCEHCSKSGINLCYTVFSGGDDLFLIGPWDVTIDLASTIQKSFTRFTGDNHSLTISAAIEILNPTFPVQRGAKIVEEELESVKTALLGFDILLNKPKKPEKDALSIFGEKVRWRSREVKKSVKDVVLREPGFFELLDLAKKIYNTPDGSKPKRGWFYKLLNVWNQTFNQFSISTIADRDILFEKHKHEIKKHLPHYKYAIGRIRKDHNEFVSTFEHLIQQSFPWIRIPLLWNDMMLRGKELKK